MGVQLVITLRQQAKLWLSWDEWSPHLKSLLSGGWVMGRNEAEAIDSASPFPKQVIIYSADYAVSVDVYVILEHVGE